MGEWISTPVYKCWYVALDVRPLFTNLCLLLVFVSIIKQTSTASSGKVIMINFEHSELSNMHL
jgi:hypothetical protein